MKCKNCGGQIGLNVEKCPYCNSVNKIAVKRRAQLDKLNKENMRLENKLMTESKNDVAYRLHKRLNWILAIAGIVFFGGVFLWNNLPEGLENIKNQTMINYYYEQGRYEDMYWYMKDNDTGWNYDNCKIGVVWRDYQSLLNEFAEVHEIYVSEGVYDKDKLNSVLCKARFMWSDLRFYDLGEKEMPVVEEYKNDVIMILTGAFKMSTEECDMLLNAKTLDYDEIVALSTRVWEAMDER